MRRRMLIALQHPGGDRDVVEHAEAFAAIGKRMVRAAGEVRRHAVIERDARRRDRRADRSPRALDHLRATTEIRCAAGCRAARVPFMTAST